MTKTFIIDGSIDEELLCTLSGFYNELTPDVSKVIVLLCSDGGLSHTKEAILELLTEYKDFTELKAFGCIASAAFELFFEYPGQKALTNRSCGMYHLATTSITFNSAGTPADAVDKFSYNYLTSVHNRSGMGICELVGMPEYAIDLIKDGKDVYFTQAEMQKFLLNSLASTATHE